MQRSLKRFVILSEKQRQSQDGELPTAPRPGSQRQHSSRLVQVLNSQLRRGDGGDGAQPGPATLAVGPSCTPGEGAIAAGSLPQQPGPCEQDAAAPAPCSPATRACPICGEQWPTADFEAHLTQELLALEEEDDDSAAQAPLPGPPLQPTGAPHGPCHGGLQQSEQQQQHRQLGCGSNQVLCSSDAGSGAAGLAQQHAQQPHPQQPPGRALQPTGPRQHRQQHGQPPRLHPAAKKQRVVVLGGRPQETAPTDPRALQWRQWQRQQRQREEERAGVLSVFNHYSDGAGFWDSEDIGIDGAENAGLQWEGMGTCNL